MTRKPINHLPGQGLVIEIGGENFAYEDCEAIAKIEITQANVSQNAIKTRDGRFIYVVAVGDTEEPSGFGILHGWYFAQFISQDDAMLFRKSWKVLQEQPPIIERHGRSIVIVDDDE